MSAPEPKEAKDAKKEAPASAAGKRGVASLLLAILLPPLFSAGGAYAAARAGVRGAAVAPPSPEQQGRVESRPPGPTVALDPFLVTIPDATKKAHAMKVTMAVEFEHGAKEDALKSYTPRIRDAVLGYLRAMQYEEVVDAQRTEKLRADILERCKLSGAISAQRVLVTDLVVQ